MSSSCDNTPNSLPGVFTDSRWPIWLHYSNLYNCNFLLSHLTRTVCRAIRSLSTFCRTLSNQKHQSDLFIYVWLAKVNLKELRFYSEYSDYVRSLKRLIMYMQCNQHAMHPNVYILFENDKFTFQIMYNIQNEFHRNKNSHNLKQTCPAQGPIEAKTPFLNMHVLQQSKNCFCYEIDHIWE